MSENMGKADSIEPKASSVFTNGNIVSVNLNGKLSEEKAFAIIIISQTKAPSTSSAG